MRSLSQTASEFGKADIITVRTTRARIIRLRNDYKALMSKIELGLHEHHASYQASQSRPTSRSTQDSEGDITPGGQNEGLVDVPFAKVNSVVAGSPASDAGLRAGDQIRRFGNINWINHEKLSKVAEVVQRNQDVRWAVRLTFESYANGIQRNVIVKIVRGTAEELTLQLVPRINWGGRGLLGCHLLPA